MAELDIDKDMEGATEIGAPLRAKLSMAMGAKEAVQKKKAQMRHFSAFLAATVVAEGENTILPSKVVAFLYFRKPLDLPSTSAVLKERLCQIPRFRSTVAKGEGKGEFSYAYEQLTDAELNMAFPALVKEEHSVKTPEDLNRFATQLYADRMEAHLPLWRVHLINNMADGRSLMVFTVDHAVADGTALIQVLMSVLDDPPKLPVPSSSKSGAKAAAKKSSAGCMTQFKGLVQACWGPFIGDQLPADPPNRLKTKNGRKPGRTKSVATTPDVTLEQVKALREKLPGITINDILMAMTTLTLQGYYEKYEPKSLRQKVRANFPINMRTVTGAEITTEEHFGNRFSQGQLRLPVHISDPLKVLANIKGQIDVIKVSPEPYVRDRLINFLILKSGLGLSTVQGLVLDAYAKVTAMLSNVPGPMEEVQFMGQALDDLSFYCMAPFGLYFGVVQYKGNFKVGICCDAECEPEPARLAEFWVPAFERLWQAASASK